MRQGMRIVAGVLAGVLAISALGCSEKPERSLQRAELALDSGNPNAALTYVKKVLDAEPKNQKAWLIRYRAQMALHAYDPARTTLQSLEAIDPQSVEVRQRLVEWTVQRLAALKNDDREKFATDQDLQDKFEQIRREGLKTVDWISQRPNSTAEVNYDHGLLSNMDAARYVVVVQAKQRQEQRLPTGADHTEIQGQIKELAIRRDTQINEAENFFKDAVAADPRFAADLALYAQGLIERKKWPELWTLAQQVSKEKNLPPSGVAQLVLGLAQMPEVEHPQAQSIEVANQLLQTVDPARRSEPQWMLSKARVDMGRQDHAAARATLTELVKKNPNDEMALFMLAQACYAQKDYPKAKEYIDKVAGMPSVKDSPTVWLVHGLILMELKDDVIAIETLRQAVAKDPNPNSPDAQRANQAIIQIKARQGDLPGQEELVNQRYKETPDDPTILTSKIRIELAHGNKDVAAQVLANAEKIRPLTVQLLWVLAEGYHNLPNHEKALFFAQQLAQAQPGELANHLRVADEMLGAGPSAQTEPEVRKFLADLRLKFPSSPKLDQLLAELYLKRNAFEQAAKLLEPVVKAEPLNRMARLTLASAYAGMDLLDDAIEQIKAVTDQDPTDPQAHELAYKIWLIRGDKVKANEELWQIDESKIDEARQPAVLAQIKYLHNDKAEAAAICNRAIANGNRDMLLRWQLEQIYRETNKPDKVEQILLNIVELEPNNPRGWLRLSQFYASKDAPPGKGIVQFHNLSQLNDTLAALGEANLLVLTNKPKEGIDVLEPRLKSLISQRARSAMIVADTMAGIYSEKLSRQASAVAVYDPFLVPGQTFMVEQAKLRQIELRAATEEPKVTVAALKALLPTVGPEQTAIRGSIINRLAAIGLSPKGEPSAYADSLAGIDQWIKDQPDDVGLLSFKSRLLLQANRPADAAKVLQVAVEKAPTHIMAQLALAQALSLSGDYPAAEAAYEKAAKMNSTAELLAIASLGEMYLNLGLNHQAGLTFDRLERLGRPRDPRILAAMGRALALLGKEDQARARLADVPSYSPQYTAAQILLAQLEQNKGMADEARKRLEDLANNPDLVVSVVNELMRQDLSLEKNDILLRAAEKALHDGKSLPPDVQARWIGLRFAAADRHGDGQILLDTFKSVAERHPESVQALAGEALIFIRLSQPEAARQLLTSNPALAADPRGALLAVVLNEKPAEVKDLKPLPAFIIAVAQGDAASARKAAESLPPMRTIYKADLLKIVDRGDFKGDMMVESARRMALALVAHDLHLPQLATQCCQETIARMPLTPAYALLLEDQGLLSQPTTDTVDKLLKSPSTSTSTLARFMDASRKLSDKSTAAAATLFQQLLTEEPNNGYIQSGLAQALDLSGKRQEAAEVWLTVYQKHEPKTLERIQAGNNAAYLLATYEPKRLAEARDLAQKVLDESDGFAALKDTLAWIDHLAGDDAHALDQLNQALPGISGSLEVHYHAGAIYNQLGNKKWAAYHLAEAVNAPADQPYLQDAQKLMAALGPPATAK